MHLPELLLITLVSFSTQDCTIFSTTFMCTNLNQKELTFELNSKITNEDNVTTIVIADSNLTELDNSFSSVDDYLKNNVLRIDITNSRVKKIDESALSSFKNLQSLDLSHNELEDVSFIATLPASLTELYLRNNSIKKVGDVFNSLKNIRLIDLSCCQIDNFDFTVFDKNPKLKLVNVSYNNLHTAESKEFLKNIECVDISHNDLSKHINIPSYCLDFSFTNSSGYHWYNVSETNQTVYVSKFFHVGNNKLQLYATNRKKDQLQVEIKHLNISMFRSDISELNLTKVKVTNELNLSGSVVPLLDKSRYDLGLLFYDEGTNASLDLSNCSISNISTSYFSGYSLGKLNLCYNNFSKLATGTFSNSYIIVLDICHGKVQEIEEGGFDGLHVRKLNLSYNNLHQINFLRNIRSINILDLSNNQIETIGNVFTNLESVEVLDISHNIIQDIDTDAFKSNTIKSVDLRNNKLVTISTEMFKDVPNLQRLYLQRNPVVIIGTNTFRNLSSLQEISLADMEIGTIQPGAFVELKNLEQLDLSNNKISIITSDVFVAVPNLQRLYLDQNPVLVLDTDLNLQFLKLTMDQNFQCSNLRLSSIQNFYIKDSIVSTFCGLQLQNLRALYLENVQLKTVNAKTLQGLHNLHYLQEQQLFKDVKVIKTDTFKDVNSVTNLDLSSLNIVIIEPQAFSGLANLEKLLINNNNLVELRTCSFCGLQSVWYLNLANNKISQLHPAALQGLDNLVYLSLKDNYIIDIPSKVFQGLNRLTVLDLNNNRIERLDGVSLLGLSSLKVLDISNNNLKIIGKNVLGVLRSVEHVNLEENRLEGLEVKSFDNPNFKFVNIYGNRWKCDNVEVITRYFAEKDVTVFGNKNVCSVYDQ